MNREHRKLIIGCLLIVLCLAAGRFIFPLFLHDEASGAGTGSLRAKGKLEEQIVTLTISCVGDVMVHQPQIPSQYDSVAKQYDFTNNFQYIREHIEQADLALCNVETTLRGMPYTGYPTFSSPESLASALREAGFDVAITANNHMMDTGYSGMQRTLEVLRENGFVTVGSQLAVPEGVEAESAGQGGQENEDEPFAAAADRTWHAAEPEKEYALVDVNGVTVGIVAYTYATGEEGAILVNGSRISGDAEPLINYFRYTHLAEDLTKVEANISDARRDGADLIIVYYHWGEEYQRSPNDWQLSIARQTAEMGADMIFASHPHVLQGMEMLEVEDNQGRWSAMQSQDAGETGQVMETGQESEAEAEDWLPESGQGSAAERVRYVPVFYSMGNFISNQREETLSNHYTEQGMIANVQVEYNLTRGQVVSVSMDAIPTWVDRYRSGAAYTYTIVPLTGDFESNPDLVKSGHADRARQALEDVKKLLGEENVR